MFINKIITPKRKRKTDDLFNIQEGKFKDGKINSHTQDWIYETYLTDAGDKEKIGKNYDFSKSSLLAGVLIGLTFLLLAKCAWLQVLKGDYYYEMAEGNRIRIERVEPKRGIIYDRDMNSLVRNKANFILYFIPSDLPSDEREKQKIFKRIGEILISPNQQEIINMASSTKKGALEAIKPLFVADNIEYEKAMQLYLESANWPGVVLSSKVGREYLYVGDQLGDLASKPFLSLSHILGYTGKISPEELEKAGDEYLPIDYIGKMGVEYFWENELKGVNGKKQVEVDALGKEKKVLSEQKVEDGHNLILTIDINQQKKLEELLLKHLKELKLNKASAVVMDPNNGEVLALVSIPSYDNNKFASGISQNDYQSLLNDPNHPLFNRAISGEFPSGSTFKIVMASAALQERMVSENTTVLSTGGISVGPWFFPDWAAGGHGTTNVRRALAESINTFFYYIGGGYQDFRGLGVDRIVKYGKLFGLGTQTGVDLPGEASGLLPTSDWKKETKGEPWYIGDTYHLSIGQGDLLTTPLQVALFTSVAANRGKLYRPHIVKKILSSTDEPLMDVDNAPVRQNFIDDYNMNVVREGLRQTVTSGSGRALNSLPVEVAGKTGTAQWNKDKKNHAWFTGFAPYKNPEIVITILLEEGGEGSSVSVPIAKEYLQWYFGEYKKL